MGAPLPNISISGKKTFRDLRYELADESGLAPSKHFYLVDLGWEFCFFCLLV